ncbi:uncharacterized protein PRCAT00004295001 [Priceomyces carsonii]|uniref:uncharacterized protein n=1 Tax=Priceomyces carsonii TaxID=28549 RepID=UPI002ED89414|nr:unnamed protein product [Priceomyces carsonii]
MISEDMFYNVTIAVGCVAVVAALFHKPLVMMQSNLSHENESLVTTSRIKFQRFVTPFGFAAGGAIDEHLSLYYNVNGYSCYSSLKALVVSFIVALILCDAMCISSIMTEN